jgi:hypothetical protein
VRIAECGTVNDESSPAPRQQDTSISGDNAMPKKKTYNHDYPYLNTKKDSISPLPLQAGDDKYHGPWTASAKELDSTKGYTWSLHKVLYESQEKMTLLLKCTKGSNNNMTLRPKGKKILTTGLDSGDLIVTLTDNGNPIDVEVISDVYYEA